MRKFLYISILLIMVSCQDFLDQEPQTSISKADALQDQRGVEATLNGTYAYLATFATLYAEYMNIYPELSSGNIQINPNRSDVPDLFPFIQNFNFIANFSPDTYENFYRAVAALNDLLSVIDAVEFTSAERKQQVKGEAIALRALIHFELLRLYAQPYNYTEDASHLGIVYQNFVATPTEYSERKTVAECYDLVIEDFNTAYSLLENVSFSSLKMSPAGIQSLLSRVYLYQQNYSAAATAATLSINKGPFLASTNELPMIWNNDQHASEHILRLDASTITRNSMSRLFGFNNERAFIVITEDALSLYDSADVRGLQSGGLITENSDGFHSTLKFPNVGNNQSNDITIIRMAEVYLNRAEAYAALGRNDLAQRDLNSIRLRANPSANEIFPTGETLKDSILLERRKELAFEGHYLFDLTRNKRGVQRTFCAGSANCSLDYPSPFFIMPLPLAAIIGNPELEQNDNY